MNAAVAPADTCPEPLAHWPDVGVVAVDIPVGPLPGT